MNNVFARNLYLMLCKYYKGELIILNGHEVKRRFKLAKILIKITNSIESIIKINRFL